MKHLMPKEKEDIVYIETSGIADCVFKCGG